MKPISIADALGIFAVDGEELPTCSWCGKQVATGLGVDDCLCGMCKDCKFLHDGGPCRSGVVLYIARSDADGFVHSIQWSQQGKVLPTCWPWRSHTFDLPPVEQYEPVDTSVDCLDCIARGS